MRVTSTGAGFQDTQIVARLDELERKFEESPHRYFASLANEYRKAGDPQRAAEMCRKQLDAIPGHISGHIVLGQALYDSRDFEESRAALERALTLDPENIVALRYLGDIARDTGDVPGAERWYTRTLEADPYNEAATAALQAIRDSAPSDPPEIAVASEAAAPMVDPRASGFEPTSLVEQESPAPDRPAPDELDVPQIAVDLDSVAAAVAPTASQPANYPDPVPEPVSEPAPAPAEAILEPESVAVAEERAQPETQQELSPEAASDAAEFAGDLEISAAGESAEPMEIAAAKFSEETRSEIAAAEFSEETRSEIAESAPGNVAIETVEHLSHEQPNQPIAKNEAVADTGADEAPAAEPADVAAHPLPEPDAIEPVNVAPHPLPEPDTVEPVDVAPHPLPEPVTVEELIQTEERVMESAAPFVTETMADLYLEQGYPHEALELLLQLSEQRPDDAQLREKVENIKSVIAARRDAAVAAARAERAEATETAEMAASAETTAMPEPVTAPENTPLAAEPLDVERAPIPGPPAPRSVRELFARMDNARPRGSSGGAQRAPSRLRSDFVPIPDLRDASQPADDPFGFPDAQPAPPPPSAQQPGKLPRTSGPHPMFDPSTAEPDDFDAWLRGLRGP